MTLRTRCGRWPRARELRRAAVELPHDSAGFALVEILAATTILVIVLISFSTLLVDSLTQALRTKQSEVAASIASDLVENASALGETALIAAPVGSTPCASLGTLPVPVPVRTASSFLQCFTIIVDSYSYTVTPTLPTPSLSSALAVSVAITSLPVSALTAPVGAGSLVIASGASSQTFVTTGAIVGALSIPISSATPSVLYPTTSKITVNPVDVKVLVTWSAGSYTTYGLVGQ